jgi:trans-aconitate 2-methyltransferase
MKSPEEVANFYDEYSNRQETMWHNERHYFLIEQLKRLKIGSVSNILEIGCGIGTMTNLIAPLVKEGKLISSDISPKSIEISKKYNKEFKNIEFIVADSTNYTFPKLNYDFIVLFDVLEHIQTEFRPEIIKLCALQMEENTQLLINVPSPEAHKHAKENFPDAMQLVEIPVYLKEILPILDNNNLEIISFFSYDMWQPNEYDFYQIRKKRPYQYMKLTPPQYLNPQWIVNRIKRRLSF